MVDQRTREPIEPVRKSVVVPGSIDAAFTRFTAGMGTWWPLRSHSLGQKDAATCIFEEREGGKIYELWRDGRRIEWGEVLSWNPPHSVTFTWHPGQARDVAQQVELRFTTVGKDTRLDLVHSGWERLGKTARKTRSGYHLGWNYVLRRWAGQPPSVLDRVLNGLAAVATMISRRPPLPDVEPAQRSP
jgi:uncharacterized protein YndB with AHSA1/START domain